MSKPFPLTLRVLAHLLSYPDTSLRDHLAEMTTALQWLYHPSQSERFLNQNRNRRFDPCVFRWIEFLLAQSQSTTRIAQVYRA